MSLPPAVEAWRAGGTVLTLAGRRVFVRVKDGGGPPLLLLHGFPTSSFDWRGMWDLLGTRSLIALDFVGFGLSQKPADLNRLHHQADVVEALLAARGVEEVVIVAHDMGTSVATELMARHQAATMGARLRAVMLFNGSVVVERASLTRGQKLLRSPVGGLYARLANRRLFTRALAELYSPGHPMSAEEQEAAWALMSRDGGTRRLHLLINYVSERITHKERWHGAIGAFDGPFELAWGTLDPVATTDVLEAIQALRPAAPVTRLDDLSHFLLVEDPERMAGIVREFAERVAPGAAG
jgi:pimeloyl-ACP methyl ester carboxylesterase